MLCAYTTTGASLGKHFTPSQLKLALEDLPETPTFTVKMFLSHKDSTKVPGTNDFEVQWMGYDVTTWKHEDNFVERQCVQAKEERTTSSTSLTQPSAHDTAPVPDLTTPTRRVSKGRQM